MEASNRWTCTISPEAVGFENITLKKEGTKYGSHYMKIPGDLFGERQGRADKRSKLRDGLAKLFNEVLTDG